LVSVGLGKARVDKAGKPACEKCGDRLSRCKGKPHLQSPGYICNACYLSNRRSFFSNSSPARAPPPKRRRHTSDPGESSSHTSLAGNTRISAPLQLASTSVPVYSFFSHGWRFHDETRAGKTLASVWKSIVPEVKEWEVIRGQMSQTAASISFERAQVEALRISARGNMEMMMRAMMRKDGTDESVLYLAEMQLVVSPYLHGLQKPHYDLVDFEVAHHSHVIIFYCDDTDSTAVPVHTLEEMRSTFMNGEKRLSIDAHSLAASEDSYKSFPVRAGSALHMSALALHHGIKNLNKTDRRTVFGLFVPKWLKGVNAQTMRYPSGAPLCPNELLH
jgi:hypothetical protein